MKRAAAFAAMVALLALPAMAQRGGGHGGSGGHASGGFAGHAGGFGGHAGFSGGSAPHFGGFSSHGFGAAPRFGGYAPRYGGFAPRYGVYAPRGYAPRGFIGSGGTRFTPRAGAFAGRMPYRGNGYGRAGNAYAANGRNPNGGDHGRHRRPFYNGFNGLPYAYNYGYWPSYGFEIDPWSLGPDWLDYDDWDDNSDQSAQNEYDGSVPAPYPDYGQPGPAYGEPGSQYGEPAPDAYAAPQPYPPDEPEQYQAAPGVWQRQSYTGDQDHANPQQAVTLIFNNGHSPETIHNYMLTASTLTVLDHGYRQIPVDLIDVPATEAANRAQGIHFQVPTN